MKKIAILLLCATIFTGAYAQEGKLIAMKATWGSFSPSGNAFDTIKTTAAVYLYTPSLSGVKGTVNIEAKAVEVSGTTSGTLTLEASMDGTNWYSYYASKDSVYSYTLTDVTTAQVYRWQISGGDKYYRIKAVGGGSVSVRLTGQCSYFNKP